MQKIRLTVSSVLRNHSNSIGDTNDNQSDRNHFLKCLLRPSCLLTTPSWWYTANYEKTLPLQHPQWQLSSPPRVTRQWHRTVAAGHSPTLTSTPTLNSSKIVIRHFNKGYVMSLVGSAIITEVVLRVIGSVILMEAVIRMWWYEVMLWL